MQLNSKNLLDLLLNPLRDFHGFSKQVDVSCGWLTKPSAASTKVPARKYLFSGKQVWVRCFGMHQRHWSCFFTVPVEVFDAITFGWSKISHPFCFFGSSSSKVWSCVCSSSSHRSEGGTVAHYFCCLQALGSFSHVSLLENSCVLAAPLWGTTHAAFMKPCVRWHAPIITLIQH